MATSFREVVAVVLVLENLTALGPDSLAHWMRFLEAWMSWEEAGWGKKK
jgi:hypothetical protein